MPTAEAFRSGADEVRSWLETLPSVVRAIEAGRDDPGFSGSTVADAVPAALASTIERLGDVRSSCSDLIDVLEHRAALCDAYTEAYREWERRHARWSDDVFLLTTGAGGVSAGPEPVAPTPPFPGATVG